MNFFSHLNYMQQIYVCCCLCLECVCDIFQFIVVLVCYFLNVHVFYKNYFLDTCEVEGVLFALRSKNK